ncbi:DNA polymerase-3 subunit epsilon [Rubricella aquisinus]|uniref:DNA-directed DNA polymerase n=1 Tax=Rubricella aquisinus TaxID=2028108 RepID=A0A840X5B0_9RHOB|nr:exonuclease domain-containing protein [Rubricella aquisinus]MBB5515887.1 DNA polymerase-3 subunit epsilon [Rubricella aquisinus]
MATRHPWPLRLRMALFFALIVLGSAAVIIGGAWWGMVRTGYGAPFVMPAVVGIVGVAGITAWVWLMFDENVARPLERLASALTLRARGVADGSVDLELGKYLGDITPAVGEVARVLAERREAEQERLTRETARLAGQRETLGLVLQSLADAVIVATTRHRITLMNREAERLLAPEGQVGLDRDITTLLYRETLEDALAVLHGQGGRMPHLDLMLATQAGGRVLTGRMTLLRDGQEAQGYTLALRNITDRVAGSTEDATAREVFTTDTLIEVVARALPSDTAFRLRGSDGARAVLCADGVAMIRLVARLVSHVADTATGDIGVRVSQDALHLSWDGPALDDAALAAWRAAQLKAAHGAPSVADVLSAHGLRIRSEDGHVSLNLPLLQTGAGAATAPEARPEFYDFDLMTHPDVGREALADLTYVVFDTETTGLSPSGGDRLVQIAGQRIVNGRIQPGDVFDRLVNPGRPIPPAATKIHGLSDAGVAHAPDAAEVVAAFEHYAEGAVWIAHNAPFDMAFLAQAGARADAVVLDTVLLSALAFPHEADHTLDGLATRLDVTIPEALRHTALGDAVATAEVFLKLLPLLDRQGITTLKQAVDACATLHGLRRKQAKY